MAWYVTRWGSLFVVTYVLARESGSPFVIQSAGALLFLPLLAGGFLGGRLAQGGDPWRVLIGTLLVLSLVSGVLCVVASLGEVRHWMLFPFILLVGVGQLVNMTAHRDVLGDVVGPHHFGHALVVEAVQVSTSMALGNVAAGALIQVGGPAAAFGAFLLLQLAALQCFRRARAASCPTPSRERRRTRRWRPTIELLRRSRALRLALAITVSMNTFVYGYLSLVPLLTGRFDSSPLASSLVAAGDGVGQVCAGVVLVAAGVRRPGRVLALGAITTCVGILLFSQSPGPELAFVALVVAGVGTSGFAATQTVVALRDAAPAERGAVLGLVSTAIGATPVGMMLIGALAGVLPAQTALGVTVGVGLVIVLAIAACGRDTLRSA